MDRIKLSIEGIPALVWGEASERVILAVHGSSSHKEDTPIALLAQCASEKGCQVLSFDLPGHGERAAQPARCGVQEGVRELRIILRYAQENWKRISLFANSLGAYFSLLAYREAKLEKSLFVSPILDMEKLIRDMMGWAGVTREQLNAAGEIPTAFGETLSWKYLTYAAEHRIAKWDSPTAILYAGQDHLTARQTVDDFARQFGCAVTVMENGEHWFHTEEQLSVLDAWLQNET